MSKIQITAIITFMSLILLTQIWMLDSRIHLYKDEPNQKYELVQFDNGNYGIRRHIKYSKGEFEYNDLSSSSIHWWWPKDSKYFIKECQTTEQKARERLDELNKPKPDYSSNLSITEKIIE